MRFRRSDRNVSDVEVRHPMNHSTQAQKKKEFRPWKAITALRQEQRGRGKSWREMGLLISDHSVDADALLKPFKRGRPKVRISREVKKTLERREVWQSTEVTDTTVVGQAIVDVEAPPRTVWKQLLYRTPPKKLPGVSECKVYKRRNVLRPRHFLELIYVKFVSPVMPGFKLTNYVLHIHEPSRSSITWMLDAERHSDFKELQGHWHVASHPKSRHKARVYYEIGLITPRWIPARLVHLYARRAIDTTASRLRSESELAAGTAKLIGGHLVMT